MIWIRLHLDPVKIRIRPDPKIWDPVHPCAVVFHISMIHLCCKVILYPCGINYSNKYSSTKADRLQQIQIRDT